MSHAVTRRAALLSALALPALALSRPARADGPLKVGVTPGANGDSIAAAATVARAQGLEVEVVEFSD